MNYLMLGVYILCIILAMNKNLDKSDLRVSAICGWGCSILLVLQAMFIL